jgi:MYXO-CTERM domain-containing protein
LLLALEGSMKRSIRCLLAVAPLLAGSLLGSLADAKELPNYNAYYLARAAKAGPGQGAASGAVVASRDAQRGVPTFLWAGRAAWPSQALTGLAPEAAARLHLEQHAAQYGLSAAALSTAFVTQVLDTGRGGITVVLRQRPGGVEVLRTDVKVLMDRNLELVAIGGNLHAAAVPSPKSAGFKLGQAQALGAALKDLYGVAVPAGDLLDLKDLRAGFDHFDVKASSAFRAKGLHLSEPARVKRAWFPMPDRLVPAYFIEFYAGKVSATSSDAYAYAIAADDGRLLFRENLTHADTFSYRVYADATGDNRPQDGPIADYCPYPAAAPNGSYPAYAPSTLISIDGFNKTHDPWLPAGAMVSTGNNIDAYTDDDAPDGFSGGSDIRATPTAAGAFDRAYDPTIGPQSSDFQRMASITDLFYVTNWMHDWWYDSGFDEADGNAQASNYGRGGVEGDVLHAEAQDGAPGTRDNSDMSVPSDGMSPRMQMYVWDGVGGSSSLNVQPLNQNLASGGADFGPSSFNVSGTLALVNDSVASPSVTDACEAITNDVSGKIAVIDRGTCSFQLKVANAQAAGAIAAIIIDKQTQAQPPHLFADPQSPNVTIPSLSVTLANGNSLKTALMNGAVTATMNVVAPVDRDGTLDNTVVAHEWGHYLHLRHVACGSQSCGAQSEGWADFNALMMTMRQGDDLGAAYPLAQYATASFPDDPAYFGIRRYPYSVDLSKNPLTFKHISDGENLPNTAPLAQGNAGGGNSEVHAAGEVWAEMLFEAYAALLKQTVGPNPPYTFDEARRRMTDYVVTGMRLAPADPTYTEQRDGVLAAAAAADLSDLSVLAQAFARRGAGTCAVSPPRDSLDLVGVVESFTVQPDLEIVSVKIDDAVKSCDSDGHLDAEETGNVTVVVVNGSVTPFDGASVTVSSTSPDVTFPAGTKVNFGTLAPHAKATGTVQIALASNVAKMELIDLKVKVDDPTSCASSATMALSPRVNFDEIPAAAAVDTVEASKTPWKLSGTDSAKIWAVAESAPGNHVWAGTDNPSPSDTSLVSPALTVSATAKLVITFDHAHQFEHSDDPQSQMAVNWDGAVIEISSDNGTTWEDISKYGDPGYGGTIGDPAGQAMNVLKDRQGYVDTNPSWPATDTVTIDLGTKLAGKTVKVRFRIGTDDAAGGAGWRLDNLKFDGITNTPFPELIDDKSSCGAPPIADAGPDQTVVGGTVVTLDGSKSFDPGSQPLTYAWSETTGAPVTLAGASTAKATFTAPSVAAPTTLTLTLQVNDGKSSASDTVNVLVTPGGGTGGAGGGGGATLMASGGSGCDCATGGGGADTGALASLLALAGVVVGARRRRRSN